MLTTVVLPVLCLSRLQISNNGWLPMSLPLYPALVQLQASNANVRGFRFDTSQKSFQLQQLVLDHSVLAEPPGSTPLWDALLILFRYTQALQYLSCNNCSLQVRTPPALSISNAVGELPRYCLYFSVSYFLCIAVVCQLDLSSFLADVRTFSPVSLIALHLNSVSRNTHTHTNTNHDAHINTPRCSAPRGRIRMEARLEFSAAYDLCLASPTARCAVPGCHLENALQNQLSGTFSPATFSASGALLPSSLKQLDLSYNPDLRGPLPPAGATFTDLQEIVSSHTVTRTAVVGGRRPLHFFFFLLLVVPPLTPFLLFAFFVCVSFSSFFFFFSFLFLSFPSPFAVQNLAGTGVSSGLPSTWGAFSALQHLTLSDTQIQCPLTVDTEGEVSPLPLLQLLRQICLCLRP